MQVSVRIDQQLQTQLRAIADSEGISVSEVVRRAVVRYVESSGSLRLQLEDVIGSIESGGGRASRSGETFKRIRRQSK